MIPTLLPELLQIQNGKSVEVILPAQNLKEEQDDSLKPIEGVLKPTSEEPPIW